MYPESITVPQQMLLPKTPCFPFTRVFVTGQLEDRRPAFINASETTTIIPLLSSILIIVVIARSGSLSKCRSGLHYFAVPICRPSLNPELRRPSVDGAQESKHSSRNWKESFLQALDRSQQRARSTGSMDY